MRPISEQLVRAGLALQVAALEYDKDDSGTQCEARQAVLAMEEALESAKDAVSTMTRLIADRRRMAKKEFR